MKRSRGEPINSNHHYIIIAIILITTIAIVIADPPTAPDKPTPPAENSTNCSDNIEICDGLDNNCNDLIDENLIRNATCGYGICQAMNGTETCHNGTWINSTCTPLNISTDEVCDGLDNDCDNQTDEISACTPPSNDKDGGKGGSGGGSYTLPDNDEEEEEEPSPPPVTTWAVELNWKYENETNEAQTNISNENSSVLRISGPMSKNTYEEKAPKRIIIDTAPKDNDGDEQFTPLQRITFTDEENNTHNQTYEEITIEFTLARGMLYDLNITPEDISLLYQSQGAWRRGNTTYSASTGTYQAELVNVDLNELLIGTYKEITLQPAQAPKAEEETIPEEPAAGDDEQERISTWPFIIIVMLVLGGGGAAFYFLHEKKEPPATAQPAAEQQRPKETYPQPATQTAATSPMTEQQEPRTTAQPTLNEQVLDYINRQRAKGVPNETIKQKLLSNGWKEESVQEYLGQ